MKHFLSTNLLLFETFECIVVLPKVDQDPPPIIRPCETINTGSLPIFFTDKGPSSVENYYTLMERFTTLEKSGKRYGSYVNFNGDLPSTISVSMKKHTMISVMTVVVLLCVSLQLEGRVVPFQYSWIFNN